jgi:hypothetical protein
MATTFGSGSTANVRWCELELDRTRLRLSCRGVSSWLLKAFVAPHNFNLVFGHGNSVRAPPDGCHIRPYDAALAAHGAGGLSPALQKM